MIQIYSSSVALLLPWLKDLINFFWWCTYIRSHSIYFYLYFICSLSSQIVKLSLSLYIYFSFSLLSCFFLCIHYFLVNLKKQLFNFNFQTMTINNCLALLIRAWPWRMSDLVYLLMLKGSTERQMAIAGCVLSDSRTRLVPSWITSWKLQKVRQSSVWNEC